MEWETIRIGAIALAGLGLVVGGLVWGWLRGPLIVALALLTLAATAVVVLLVVGGFALESAGGGAMLLFVIPAGLLAVLAGMALMVVWGSLPVRGATPAQVERAGREAMGQWQADLEADLQRREAQLQSRWMLPGKRRALEAQLRERRLIYAQIAKARRGDEGADGQGAASS
jgi:hypothetical protein